MKQFIILISILSIACKATYKNPHVEIQTKLGDIELELYPDQAPKSVAAFLSYVDSGYYKDCTFYRVLRDDNQPSDAPKAELIQGGLWANRGKRPDLPGIPHESTQQTHILHKEGVISLARTAPGTATTEFFICMDDEPGLDYGGENNPDKQGYASFGKVVKGMDVVKQIYSQSENDQYFDPPIAIYKIRRL